MSLIWISLALVAFFFFLRALLWKRNTNSKRLPPGPRGLPIIGCLHILGKHPHRDFYKLSKKYGPIMFLRLGLMPTVVVSSPQATEQFLKTHDLVFASRPLLLASKHIAYDRKNFIFAQYGSYWRTVRKIVTVDLLSNLKINSFQPVRKQELDLFIDSIKEAAASRVAVDISAKVASLSADITCRTVFGQKYMDKELDERGFKCVIQEAMELAAIPNLGDYIPQIAPLDLQGLAKRMKASAKVFDAFFEKIIDQHLQSKVENRTKDFVDVILGFLGSEETEYRIEREHIKAIILDLLVASMDTSATVVEWAVSALIKHPRLMKKVQKELETVVGLDKMVEESDLGSLEYLDMVLKETFRLYPAVPLLLPRESREDCTINGFHIPKQSRIFINAWAIGRDPDAWTDAEKFIPERFVGSNVELNGKFFQLLPFGAGRRGCPGWQLGLTIVKLVLAQLVHCFDWELPNGMLPSELDMTEEFSFVTPRAEHLVAIPTYRLRK